MTKREITIRLDSGLETRPVALLVQMASQFQSDVYVESDTRRVNAKSIMGMMTLGLDSGSEVTISANGEDEKEAVDKIAAYLTRSLG
ncbi:MAG: HPr family phosphocarrier protein [Clostridiales bacterium]|jgi:catabolite repression HPr-like protein|uniref:HPr family phosphocarrier protein n=1 Tax=Chordicoccus furentiruminis TaxID=2709410 RepID=UPI0023A8D47C|nr:HPr family phosphocarrier protein [Chordicoccus furentiruminis]MCI6174276.1 HPr family phosphocarrier protein [Clostridiales bacterium]